MKLYGVDFTSAPSRRKAIVVAGGMLEQASGGPVLRVESFARLASFDAFERWLGEPGPWLAGFDFPFGLPRELVDTLIWPNCAIGSQTAWARLIRQVAGLTRAELVRHFKGFCDARPVGRKFAHRATDLPAGSSPSMKWVNPPVAYMLHAGAPRLLAAGVAVPGLAPGDPLRIALEAYPGLLARSVLGRASYKSDDPAKQDAARAARRRTIVVALEHGQHLLGVKAAFAADVRAQCCEDPSGDSVDAVLCLLAAGWAWQRRDARFGLPEFIDPIEGWIVGAFAI
jgi:Protein of unknown function (DUF429)